MIRQSKTTLKELTSAYRAVLRYGILCNAVALGLIASPVNATTTAVYLSPDYVADGVDLATLYPDGVISGQDIGIYGATQGQTNGFTGSTLDISGSSYGTLMYYGNLNLGDANTQSISIDGGTGDGIDAYYGAHVNVGQSMDTDVSVRGDWAVNAYEYNDAYNPTGRGTNVSIMGDTIDIDATSYGVIALNQTGATNAPTIDITGHTVDITSTGAAAVHAGNGTTVSPNSVSTVNITADQINLTATNGNGVGAMSQGVVNLVGNTKIDAKNAVLTRGNAQTYINTNGDKTVVMDGDINFNFDKNTSGTSIDAIVDIVLNGENSRWTGNTVVSYDVKPTVDKLAVNNATLTIQDGAVWNATSVEDSTGDTNGRYYTALNNLTVDNGTVNIADETRGITVENLIANNLTINGGVMHIDNSINTINGTIDDYTAGIVLGDGASISGDIDYVAGVADKYAAADNANLTYKLANALGTGIQYGDEKTITVAEGENITVNSDANFAWFDSANGLTLTGGDAGTGTIKVAGTSGGINAAVDYTDGSAQEVAYTLTANETFDGADNVIENAIFTLTGNTTEQDPGHQLTLGTDLNVGTGSTLSVNNANLTGNGALVNDANATLNINDSNIGVNVVNHGTLISDPTTYSGTVSNDGHASFQDDTFASTAELANNGTVDISGETTFESGAVISGNGTTNLTSGSTTHFNSTANATNMTLASGADFTGELAGSGTLDARNGTIDTVSGSVSGGKLYMDANLVDGTHDAFADTTGATVAAINLANAGYGTAGAVTMNMGGATVNSNTQIQGTNYYTKVETNGSDITFSDKLMNASSVHNQLGDWGQTTAGHYIGASTAYDTDTNSYSTTNGTTVGAALTALDDQVYANTNQITTNKNNIATLTGKVNTLNGDENTAGSVKNTVKNATTMTRNPGDDEYNNFHDNDSVVAAVTKLDRNMGTVHGLVGSADATETTTGKQYKGNLAVGTTVEDHLVALDSHIGDMRDFDTTNHYATSTDSVAMNLQKLDEAIYNQSALALGSANAYTDERVDKLDKDLSAGIASAVALSAVATTGVQKGEVAVSGGYGYYNGQSAAAFGAAMGLSNRWSVNAGAGLSNADVSFRAGTSYKFKLF